MVSHCEWTNADLRFLTVLERHALLLSTPRLVAEALLVTAQRVPFRHPSYWPHMLLLTIARVFDYRPLRTRLAKDLRRRGETPTNVLRLLVDAAQGGHGPAWAAETLRHEIQGSRLRCQATCGLDVQPRVFQVDETRIGRAQ